MDTNPWDVMFEDRSKFLIPYVREELTDFDRESLDVIVAFMSTHRRAFWWFGHWVFIDLEAGDLYSEDLHRERTRTESPFGGLSGLTALPQNRPCHSGCPPSQVKDDGTRYTLNEQMELLDDQEPARVQWNTCASDEDRIEHLTR
ncbi:hypothetical protein PHMEG_00040854 [Phytophthora megakarya]|uniref:Uncharacterized protein n=1 Tax=Phytophthora megakarya TaxID=4795 RepID=A0A225UCR4_9STRA|nr:hypothetical protein PHMEG_00040854 [Phytophthora megakarya]